ncbi:MAG: MDR family MFS transporter [Chryseolinea sp.]
MTSPMSFRQTLLAMLGLCFVLVLVALDQTVIGTALPTVVSELHGFDLYAWVGTSYLLTSVITVPIFGKLGDEHGRKPFVMAAIVLFTMASMLCGVAQSMMQLVLARGVQGIGGGMLVATTFACIPDMFPQARERLRWQIMFSASFGIANAFGPTLGGYLTEYWGWRWVFFVNLPVGLLSFGFVSRYLPRIRHSEHAPSSLDWPGSALIALSLGSLQLLVEWLPQHKPVAWLIGLGALCVASAVGLVWWERRCHNPVLPMSLLSSRQMAPLFALSLMMGFCMFGVVYYVPLMFQGGFGLSPNQAGLLITPFAVSITVGSILNGRIVTRLRSPNAMLYVGTALFWLCAVALSRAVASTAHALIVLTLILGGLGVGILLPNLTLFTQATAERRQLGVATAVLQSTRMIGGMLGTALIGTLVSNHYALGVHDMLQAQNAMQWRSWLETPQILVTPAQIARFHAVVSAAGQDAGRLIDLARQGLVEAVHASQWMVVGLMVIVAWLAHIVPPMQLHANKDANAGKPGANA